MSDITTGNYLRLLKDTVDIVWGMDYNEVYPLQDQAFAKISSADHFFELLRVHGLNMMYEMNQGAAFPLVGNQEDYIQTLSFQGYGLGFKMTHEAIMDLKYDVRTKVMVPELRKAASRTIEQLCANVLNNSSTTNGADGVPLCDASHPTADGNTFANEVASPATYSESILETIVIALRKSFRDPAGNIIELNADREILPPDLIMENRRILGSLNRVGTTDNDVNALRAMGILSKAPIVSAYLSSSTAHYVLTDKDQDKTLMLVTREPLMAPRVENIPNTMTVGVTTYMRLTAQPGSPYGIYRNAGA